MYMKRQSRFAAWLAMALLPVTNYYWRYWVTKKLMELEDRNDGE